jgi:hypothetical protein
MSTSNSLFMRGAVPLLLLIAACASGPSTTSPMAAATTARGAATVPRLCSTPSRDTTFIAISARFAGPPGTLFDRAAAVYAQQGYAVAVADRAGGRLVSTPHYTWPPAVATESWHGDEHPGVEARTVLVPAGPDSTDVSFQARALCQVRAPGASAPSEQVGQQLKMLTAIMLASAFSEAGKP